MYVGCPIVADDMVLLSYSYNGVTMHCQLYVMSMQTDGDTVITQTNVLF